MKKVFGFVFFTLMATVTYAQTIDQAITTAAAEMSGKLPTNTSVVVLDFQAPTESLTNYVIDELNGNIVNIGRLKPVERRQLNAIRSELSFNMSGEVSDESAQRVGLLLGSKYIIMGSIELIGTAYRMRFRAITTESATIEYIYSQNISNDKVLEALLGVTETRVVDFTTGQRATASALNLLFGAGSFSVMNDKRGGGVTATWEILGIVVVAASHILYGMDVGLDTEEYYWYGKPEMSETLWGYTQIGGFALYAVGAIYGIIRAQSYHKPGSEVAKSPLNGFGLNLVSTDKKHTDLQLTYKMKF